MVCLPQDTVPWLTAQLPTDLPWYWKSGISRVSTNNLVVLNKHMFPYTVREDKRDKGVVEDSNLASRVSRLSASGCDVQRLPRRARASLVPDRLNPRTLDPEVGRLRRLTRTCSNHHGWQLHMRPSHPAPTPIGVLGVTRPEPIDVIRRYLHKDPSCATLAWRANQTAQTVHACKTQVHLPPVSHPQPWCPALSTLVRDYPLVFRRTSPQGHTNPEPLLQSAV